ncbi:type IV conjugative transfer system pilin TraA [Lelliottia nimipressuralis]|uniref:Pilin n=1 Tax=Lelliottia nimipressuralis TaxID=69220 RepID=A0ABY3NY61_9ENTR|nr:type IV conjugative transfer system pilin TraA [Lelliottia nimipressuralis]RXJ10730.1 type IV conjugative transfer system pilin TraA [Lelliottia nimipressuralis]TYT29232.1 type IV conjugative transfer system pilin TraA [Lelliottia nimipressuralis]
MKLASMTKGISAYSNKAWGYLKETYRRHKASVALLAIMAAAPSIANAAGGTDLLASGKDDVVSTFGADSLVMMCVIIAEIIVSIGMYIKTKNLMVLMGLAVVIIFTTVGFSFVS